MDLPDYAALFKALSEPARLRIIHCLHQRGELCVCDLVAALALPQSAVSRHLAYLRNQGLVTARRSGTWMYYQLATPNAFIAHLLAMIAAEAGALPTLVQDADRLSGLTLRSCN